MSGPKYLGFDTLSLHAGQQPDPTTGSRAVPIYQTASFVFEDSDQAGSRFDIARSGHVYSRISNPTVSVLEERLASLEGGVGACDPCVCLLGRDGPSDSAFLFLLGY